MTRLAAVVLSLAVVACNDGILEVNFERMIDQRRYRAYQASEFFDDGSAMRMPPEGTVPRTRVTGDPAFAEGIVAGAYVKRIPVEVTRELVERGHDRFDTFCSPCHGIAGDGDSIVAANMERRRPPSLLDARVRAYPAGLLFRIVTSGYGMMRSYEEDLAIEDRWATISYLRALQMRTGMPLSALPLALRERAEKELP